jgi:hypothetical protein
MTTTEQEGNVPRITDLLGEELLGPRAMTFISLTPKTSGIVSLSEALEPNLGTRRTGLFFTYAWHQHMALELVRTGIEDLGGRANHYDYLRRRFFDLRLQVDLTGKSRDPHMTLSEGNWASLPSFETTSDNPFFNAYEIFMQKKEREIDVPKMKGGLRAVYPNAERELEKMLQDMQQGRMPHDSIYHRFFRSLNAFPSHFVAPSDVARLKSLLTYLQELL